MKKCVFSLLLAAILISFTACKTFTPVTAFEYEENEDGITITKYIGSDKNVVIPETIDRIPVTQIGNNAFFMNKDVVSVVLPDTIVKIGNSAFEQCTELTAVTLPSALEEIGGGAFLNCTKLEKITLPNTLTSLGSCSFKNCTSLKNITIPSDCLKDYSSEAFHGAGLESVVFAEGVTFIPDTCFAATNIREVILPKTVKTLDTQAFAGCENLETVTLNEGLNTVGDLAFYGAVKLKEIVIPSTVTYVKETTFNNCSELDKIKFEGNAPDNFLCILQGVHLKPQNVHFSVCYHKAAEGFTYPEWNGYPTEIW